MNSTTSAGNLPHRGNKKAEYRTQDTDHRCRRQQRIDDIQPKHRAEINVTPSLPLRGEIEGSNKTARDAVHY